MSRRTSAAVKSSAVDALVGALSGLGVTTAVEPTSKRGSGVVIDVAGQRFEGKMKSVISAALGEQLARSQKSSDPLLLIVADRISSDAKRSFREAGVNYFDRRGELRIVEPPIIIDTVVGADPAISASLGGSLDSQVAKEVAVACLLTPNQPHGVREIARYIDRAPSAVSNAMAGLRDDGLLTSSGEAMIPDLFHELLAVWRRRTIPLAALPDPSAFSSNQLGLNLEEPEDTMGWALTDTRAAASWGMPIVAQGDYPPDFYVPSESAFRSARLLIGEANNAADRACTAALAPIRLACFRRIDHSHTTGERWPVANHIVVALDIAADRARGLEALEQWNPKEITRAW